METTIVRADYADPRHASAIVTLLDAYARDPMGGGRPLEQQVRDNLVAALAKRPQAFSVLAFTDERPVGLVNCFEGFSTFACRPLINIHDVFVIDAFRGRGISGKMLALVEQIAREKGCCKLTLEVLEQNAAARAAYRRFGFDSYRLDPASGVALFWQKSLTDE